MKPHEKEQFLETWADLRSKGILRYVLATAVSWGTLTVVFFRLILIFIDETFSLEALRNAYLSQEFLRYWGIFLIGGIFYGLTMWFYFNWRYRKIKSEKG